MKRKEWLFAYDAAKLADAASTRKAEHLKLREWWEVRKTETLDKVRDHGVEVQESVGAVVSSTKGAYSARIQIDPALRRDLDECHSKIQGHAEKLAQFAGWEQVLRAHPDAELQLDHEDYLFFFGT
ncbi:MAG: hypothetical protein ACT4QA_15955 [Panacagrimonas sp.]